MTYTLPGAVIAAALIMLIVTVTAAALAITGSGILKHPDQADSREPGPGPCPVPGQPRPHLEEHGPPDVHAPAPATRAQGNYRAPPAENLGTVVMTVNFYDSGATVTYDHRLHSRWVDWPDVNDDDLRDWLSEDAQ